MEKILYQIRIRGHLSADLGEYFPCFRIDNQPDGSCLLTGPLPDQPALFGVLIRIRDLGLPLLSLSTACQEESISPLAASAGKNLEDFG